VLKRLADAEADHDQIYGLIVGSGINQDGATNGITAPNLTSQIELEQEIYEKYALDPESISYVEMHGTGTKLGDPIELEALATVFRERTRRQQYCAIGSVKTNIGHTLAAAGVAGLQKVLLAMKHKKLVPSLHFEQPNPHFDFEASPFYVNTEVQDWKSEASGPLRAAVSSFGFSGTNAHLVVEEYIHAPSTSRSVEDGDLDTSRPLRSPGACLFVLSAKSEPQLKSYAQEMKRWIQANAEQALADIAFTLQVGRAALDYRLATVADSGEVLLQRLEAFVDNQTSPGVQTAQVKKGTNDATLFEVDADGHSLLHIWCQKKDLEKIAQVWVRGVNVDWRLLYEKGLPCRVSLPTYPFARERYWLPTPKAEPTPGGASPSPTVTAHHPQSLGAPSLLVPHRVVLRPLADHPLHLKKEVDQSQPSISLSLPGQSFSPSRSNGVVASRDTEVSLTIGEHAMATPHMQMALSVDHEPVPQLEEELVRSLAEALSMEQSDIDVEKPFGEIGLDSVIGVEWVQSLNKQYASNLKASIIYDYPTIRQLADFLKKEVFKYQQTFVQSISALSLDDVLQQLQQGTVDIEKAEQLVHQVLTRAKKEDY
jgi:acyl transferase domain-containing protein